MTICREAGSEQGLHYEYGASFKELQNYQEILAWTPSASKFQSEHYAQ